MTDGEIVVLIVDDEPEVRALARVVLEVSGHPVRVVEAAHLQHDAGQGSHLGFVVDDQDDDLAIGHPGRSTGACLLYTSPSPRDS